MANTEKNTDKKVLLKITELRQYFPTKKKGLYVKANDGITLNIYEDETFGLVGESGCGKSTFGRTLLQLHPQTYGRTVYYGRSRDDIAPAYIKATLKTLPARRKKLQDLEAHRDKAVAHVSSLLGREVSVDEDRIDVPVDCKNPDELYPALEEYYKARKEAQDAFMDIVSVVGGFILADDLKPVVDAFMKEYGLCVERVKMYEQMEVLTLDYQDMEYTLREKNAADIDARLAEQQKKIDALQEQIDKKSAEVQSARDAISDMAKAYDGNEQFAAYDAYRDDGIDLARLNYSEMRKLRSDLQLIFQDPYSSLNPRMTVGQLIGEGLMAHNMFKKNDGRMQEYVLKVMEDCGLSPYMIHRYPHQFSGGQRQRIGIARSLALNPKFVVCDEAVSALDVSIQSQVLNLLMDMREKDKLTYLFISHDLSVVKYISDRIGVMYLGNMVELAPTAKLFAAPRHPYTEALLNAIPTTDADSKIDEENLLEGDIPSPVNPPKGCKFHTRCKYATDICRQVTPVLEEVEPEHFVACHHKLGE